MAGRKPAKARLPGGPQGLHPAAENALHRTRGNRPYVYLPHLQPRKLLTLRPIGFQRVPSRPIHPAFAAKVNPKEALFITLLRAYHDSVWSLRTADRNRLR